jgi:hypothetical protein
MADDGPRPVCQCPWCDSALSGRQPEDDELSVSLRTRCMVAECAGAWGVAWSVSRQDCRLLSKFGRLMGRISRAHVEGERDD